MVSSFDNAREALEDLEIAITSQIDYVIDNLLCDFYGSPKALTDDEVKEVIQELRIINNGSDSLE